MQTPPDRIRVLHVGDTNAMVQLEDADDRFDATTVTRGEAALSLLADGTFDCVVAADDLPESTGVDLLETVRERKPTLPFVLYANDGSEALASEAIAAGVTDYVPWGPEDDQFGVLASRLADAVGGGSRDPSAERSGDGTAEWDLTAAEYRDIFDKAEVGIGIMDPEAGTFEQVNRRWGEMLGYEAAAMQGMSVEAISADDTRFEQETAMDRISAAIEGTPQQFDWLHKRADGSTVWCEVNLKRTRIGSEMRLLAFLRDVSERKEQEQRFRAFVEGSNDVLTVLDGTGVYQYQSPSVERVFGYEPETLVGETAFEYVHPEDRENVLDRFAELAHGSAENIAVEYRFRHADGSWRWVESRGVQQPPDSVIDGFVINSRDVTDRKRHEQGIADLHEATREMIEAGDEAAVCDTVVETVERVLDRPIAGVWLRDGERLEPVADTAAAREFFDETPTYIEGESLSWRAYETGESIVAGDLQETAGLHNSDSDLRSELVLPLGEYGVMNVGAREPDAFSDNDVALAKLLAANAQVALGRAERERLLERQTDRMEFFNSILRHDVLNAVTVIRGRAEFLEAELEGEQRRDAETIVRWSDDVEEIVGRVRTVLRTLTGEGNTELEPIDLGTELRAEIERVRATYPEVTFEAELPETTTVLANDLLGDVLGNVVTNAIEHNETDGLRVAVTVEREDESVFVRVADNGTGVDDDRKEAIFRRGATGHAKSVGSGFGLFFVDVMVEEYGGDVWVKENDDGGATFVLELPAPPRSG